MSLNSKILEWENKNIWIIGASQGIGKALAIELLDRGCNLFLTSRKIDSESFKLNHSDKLSFYNGDVTNLDDMSDIFYEIEKNYMLDFVIFSQAIYDPGISISKIDSYNLSSFKTNFLSVYAFTPILIDKFRKRNTGSIVFISSLAANFYTANSGAYSLSKNSLSYYSKLIYLENKQYNLNIFLVEPGFVKTRLTEKNKFKMPFIISAVSAAKYIIHGIEKGKFIIKFPLFLRLIISAYNLIPDFIKFKIFRTK